MIAIAPLTQADRERWTVLWTDYLAFYETTLPPAQFDFTWSRLMDGTALRGVAARDDAGRIMGITHFLFHPSAWTQKPVCYLQDLFTDAGARGQGVGRALIGAVAEAARAEGSPRLYWMTQSGNATARLLYDKVARNTGFIRYDIGL